MAGVRDIFESMQTDLLGSGLFGTDTITLTIPGQTPESITTASFREKALDEEDENGQAIVYDAEARVLVSALSGTLQALNDTAFLRATVTFSSVAYNVEKASIRHGLLTMKLTRSIAAERSRRDYRR